MFIDKNKKQTEIQVPKNKKEEKNHEIAIVAIVIFALLIAAIGAFFYLKFFKKQTQIITSPVATTTDENISTTTEEYGQLPGAYGGDENGNGNGNGGTDIRAENLTFADFYKKIEDDFTVNQSRIDFPINAKTDVSNYHAISRKIDLDDYLDDINSNGFSVFDNPFSGEADNFYDAYIELSKQEIPILLTSDFLIYYYQNILKDVFKEIESNVFYQDVWEINKTFYEIANAKYREKYKEVGITNDQILEAQRLEVAYFAVALELLKPKDNQINLDDAVVDSKKFSQEETLDFEFSLPAYLEDDVKKEIDLISKANNVEKSPVMLYETDYKKFLIPEEYKSNAKLNNYYLAINWIGSVFPLYYENNDCPDCLLDKDDWTVNMIAASFVANDFSLNQELKNKWAKIYKVISFFSGLRRDLTYLHYHDSLVELFGDDYKIEDIFSKDNESQEENLSKLQNKIASYEFLEIEGGINREDFLSRKDVGMRMLQELYSPDDYIFNKLTRPEVGEFLGNVDIKSNTTSCNIDKKYYRCKWISSDIVNLISPISENDEYFTENTNYQGYKNQVSKLRNQLDNFNVDSWHNNNYWSMLDADRMFLDKNSEYRPIFIGNEAWKNKNINTILGAWVNLQLPADELIVNLQKEGSSLSMSSAGSDYDLIEPDLVLINELISNSDMLSQMLLAIEVINDSDFTYGKLSKLTNELKDIKRIVEKELKGEILDYDDSQVISSISKQYIVSKSGAKVLDINGRVENISGIKMLIMVHNSGDKKVFSVGPIFNYKER
ncbi:MAG: DUF3160 domain-containing protein [Candidatus Falkowbacteria bacterium]